jgi:hypothetical protein
MPPCRFVAPLECSDWNQTEIRHQLARIGEAGDVAEFGDYRRRRDQSIPRSACRARTTGASDQSGSAASI